jgi:DNA-directed RNA polymerase beta subunit
MSIPSNLEKMKVCDYTIDQHDLFLIGDAEIDDKGLVDHHISSVNDLYQNGLMQIITQVFKVEKDINNQRSTTDEDKEITKINVTINFTDVNISRPTMINYFSGKEEVLYPNMALMKDKTYSGNLRIDAEIIATAYLKNGGTKVRTDKISNFKLCKVPIMTKTKLCNTYGCSKETLVQLNEDPSDPGGNYIIKGVEWVIVNTENILFNQIRVFKNEGYVKEVMRVEFVSKPGGTYKNSGYFLVRLLNDNQLTCEIVNKQLKNMHIPFYLIFRLLGISNDKTMFDNIVYGYDDSIAKNIINYLKDSINVNYNTLNIGKNTYSNLDIAKLIIDELKYTDFKYLDLDANPANYHIAYNILYNLIDNHFLPHVGLKPEDRPNKIRFLGLIIRKLLLVRMGNLEPTDRDSYKSKRIHAAGPSYAKTFKTYFNASIIQQIKRRMLKDFKSTSFSQVDLASSVKSSVYGADFERAIIQTITSGNKSQITVNKKTGINRLSSNLLDRKNQLAVYSTLRLVTSKGDESSKQSERANEMRRVHLSSLGYICVIHSSEGEKVGINKQLAIFASILGSSSIEVLKEYILLDKDLLPLNKVSTDDIYNDKLCNVFINGEWIGCVKNSLLFAKKYRQLRRKFIIDPLTTIYWDNTQNETYFWVDIGRVSRPLMIVYNNFRDSEKFTKKSKEFEQGIAVSSDIINKLKEKTIDIEYLLKNNIIEYITAEEQENCYICPCFDELKFNKNNELHEYTHCDIPQAILGITAITSPYANHNQTPRIIFQTSQGKQTCGVFALNWPYRYDKDTFLQYICETPLVKTVASKYIFPNGCNTIVAIACYSGFNQEDSLIINQGAVDKGLFNGCKFTFIKDELDQKDEFANPDINTSEIKSGNYSNLVNGIIKEGSVIKKGDAIIGKITKIQKSENNLSSIDKSTIYKEIENATIHNVTVDRNEDDDRFCKILLRKSRPITIGDKFCLTGDHDILTTDGWKNIKLITTNDKVATLDTENNIIYEKVNEIYSYKHNDSIYTVNSNNITTSVTLNHKLYVKFPQTNFELIEAQKINQSVLYKKNGNNLNKDVDIIQIKNHIFYMNDWIKFLGIYINYGKTNTNINTIVINTNNNVNSMLKYLLNKMNISFNVDNTSSFTIYNCVDVVLYLKNLNTYFQSFYSKLSNNQSLVLMLYICKIYDIKYDTIYYNTNSIIIANAIQMLAIMSNHVANIIKHDDDDNYKISISNKISEKEPMVSNHVILPFEGNVYCINVKNHVFMSRLNYNYNWTGNSSRAGQKGVAGILLRESDMPFTEDGMKPSIIVNPHAIPTRMTVGQLYESLNGNWCAATGTHTDATIFKHVDITSMGNELEKLGMHRHGYHRLYSGMTGEFIDCLIFMGPTYYQRLQKFVIDAVQCVSNGPSDILTRQPLDGKAAGGGLRIGEMERDTMCAHGSTKFIKEKFFNHSDGFTEYICKCGKSAIVNTKLNIYKCKYCKDNADISSVATSWCSKLFVQEIETMNIGMRRYLTPYIYESVQSSDIQNMISETK